MILKNNYFYLAVALILTIAPLFFGEYYVNLGSQIMIAAVFAASLNILVGYGGLTSLGHATYLGLSAYTSAWLFLKTGWDHGTTAIIAIVFTTVIGAIFGWISLRASGLSFLMLTLALSQIIWGIGYRWVALTNGDNGLSGLTRPSPFGWDLENSTNFYWFTLIITIGCLFFIGLIVNSPFGASLKGTRDQDKRMSALGFNVWKIRWVSFVISSFFGAISGLLYIYFNKYVHPSVMSITSSAEALLCVIAGGAGTLAGPILGSILIVMLKNYVSGFVERWNMLLGIIFVFIVIFMPTGMVPGILQLKNRLFGVKK
ncbi:branched-chain amino acid ABC transporter permease [Polynucleobacter kasalickyi]|uniref:Branched-chain amino acid transport system permease protein n=1 Tax=Polynucleobacter kasalickyi TaxID=1938817 RepID=A0A1W1ZFX4_9BURK|nr:branched-chain amino acid ABC transporter permease [Polynucleobacter kasalickyi]SMC47314.1 branched-chain amino acid transport system permease protein [Polynucleobacter kasalickyi]